jgi:hypothetical protein
MKYAFFLYIMTIFLGCAAEYPADLSGDIVPINTDEKFKDMIEQQYHALIQEKEEGNQKR